MTNDFITALTIDRLGLYDRVKLIDSRHPEKEIAGIIRYIFRANVPRSRDDVAKFFGITEENRWFEKLCKQATRDWLVVLRDNGHTYVFPRTVEYSKFITELTVIKATPQERYALRKQWRTA